MLACLILPTLHTDIKLQLKLHSLPAASPTKLFSLFLCKLGNLSDMTIIFKSETEPLMYDLPRFYKEFPGLFSEGCFFLFISVYYKFTIEKKRRNYAPYSNMSNIILEFKESAPHGSDFTDKYFTPQQHEKSSWIWSKVLWIKSALKTF